MVLLAQPAAQKRQAKASVPIFFSRACFVFVVGQETIQPAALADTLALTEEHARQITQFCDSGYYVEAADDPSPDKRYTLTKQIKASIEGERALLNRRDAARAEEQAYAMAMRRKLIAEYGLA